MIKIALVGNIASGKSTVEKFLVQNNFKIFDCDKIAHKILEENIESLEIAKDRCDYYRRVFILSKVREHRYGTNERYY